MSRRIQLGDTCDGCRRDERAAIRRGDWVPVRRRAVIARDGQRLCGPHAQGGTT